MRILYPLAPLLVVVSALAVVARAEENKEPAPAITNEVLKTDAGDRVLVQEALLEASMDVVWRAYTTTEGYTAWAAPVAEIDLKIGGQMRTHYTPTAKIGADGTNTLTILNYVPQRVLTLRAEPAPTWPAYLRKDAERLSNVILFENLGENRTRVSSFGIGYRDTPEYEAVLGFFGKANVALLGHLKRYVEDGKRRTWGNR